MSAGGRFITNIELVPAFNLYDGAGLDQAQERDWKTIASRSS